MRVLKAGALALIVGLIGSSAAAQGRVKPTIHFFSGPESAAHWTAQDSSDPNRMSMEFKVGPASGTYAGFEFNHEEGTPAPAREPYYFHKEDRAGASGGSPRLVIQFANGNIQLRPDQWATTWQKVGEGDNDGNWDVSGGSCVFRYDVTYQEALACFPNALVQNVFLVTDSQWLYPTGYYNWVDQLQYNGYVYSHASDNSNAPF